MKEKNILIAILIIVIIVLSGFIIYEKVIKDNNKNTNSISEKKESSNAYKADYKKTIMENLKAAGYNYTELKLIELNVTLDYGELINGKTVKLNIVNKKTTDNSGENEFIANQSLNIYIGNIKYEYYNGNSDIYNEDEISDDGLYTLLENIQIKKNSDNIVIINNTGSYGCGSIPVKPSIWVFDKNGSIKEKIENIVNEFYIEEQDKDVTYENYIINNDYIEFYQAKENTIDDEDLSVSNVNKIRYYFATAEYKTIESFIAKTSCQE